MKILHGTMEVANLMHTLTTGLKKLGLQATSINYHPNYLGLKSDIVYDLRVKNISDQEKYHETTLIAAKAMVEFDLFHFYFGSTLTPNNADLTMLKNLRKPIYMHHVGSDIRQDHIAQKYSPWVKSKATSEHVKRNLDILSQYIPHTIVGNGIMYEMVKPFYDNVHILTGPPINLDEFPVAHEHLDNKRPLVVHAPTDREFKGSDYIEAALESLKDDLDFDYILVENLPHEEAKAIYRKADVIVDQILCGEHGALAVEGMAMGKTVIGYIVEAARYPAELPIVRANPDTIKDVLRTVIKDSDLRFEHGKLGRAYVEKYHAQEVIVEQLIQLYQGKRLVTFDENCWGRAPQAA